jgi:Ran-interacting Mog1 protein
MNVLYRRGSSIGIVVGTQQIRKYGKQNVGIEKVQICLSSIRLPTVATDIVVTWNFPTDTAQPRRMSVTEFEQLVTSLKVVAWSLFG